jgi:hypothetical protein
MLSGTPATAAEVQPSPSPSPNTRRASKIPPPFTWKFKDLKTVPDIWRELKHGVGGQPSVEFMDANYHSSTWRGDNKATIAYSRRKVIWDEIKRRVRGGLLEVVAVDQLEVMRGSGSLYKLMLTLKGMKKAGLLGGGGDLGPGVRPLPPAF